MTTTTFSSWDDWVSRSPAQIAPTNYPDPRRYQWTILASPSARLLGMKATEAEALDFAETINQSRSLVGETAIAVFKGYPGIVLS